MPRPTVIIVALISLATSRPVLARAILDHGILNATSAVVHVDVKASFVDVSNFELSPGDCFVFDGVFVHLRVRLHNGKTYSLGPGQLRALHGGRIPKRGHWVIDSRGVRSVSIEDYMRAFKRKTPKPNQAIQRTASKAATDVLRVCHLRFGCVERFPGLAVADLVSR